MKSHFTTTLLAASLLAAAATGCTEQRYTPEDGRIPNAVEFSTRIALTRAHDNVWEYGDTIGVYMVPSPLPPADDADEDDGTAPAEWSELEEGIIRANMAYVTNLEEDAEGSAVAFTGADEQNTLSWPNNGGAVDFVAYYPRIEQSEIENFIYPVRLAAQDPQRAIDLMWSNNLRGMDADSEDCMLVFRHRLTKLVFNVVDTGGASLEGMTATINGLPSDAGFDLSTGELTAAEPAEPTEPEEEEDDDAVGGEPQFEPFDAVLTAYSDGDEDGVKERAVAEAIVLPGEALDYDVTFTLASGEKAVFKLEDVAYVAGKRYIYNLRLAAAAGEVEFHDTPGSDDIESITTWEDETVDVAEPIIRGGKEEPTPPGADTWSSGTLTEPSQEYSLNNDGKGEYTSSGYNILSKGTVTVGMSSFEGDITSIGVTVEYTGSATMAAAGSLSVKVNGTSLVTKDREGKTTAKVYIWKSNSGEFIFATPDGKPLKGEIEIEIYTDYNTILVREFTINPD